MNNPQHIPIFKQMVEVVLKSSRMSEKHFDIPKLIRWHMQVPTLSSVRINTLKFTSEEIIFKIKQELDQVLGTRNILPPKIYVHKHLPECIIIEMVDVKQLDLKPTSLQVIVDRNCGSAVLRGADIFAPGVMGMMSDVEIGSRVSIYVDLSSTCLKGYKKSLEHCMKLFIGNGIARMNRHQLFVDSKTSKGIAVTVTDVISGIMLCNYKQEFGMLQNIPSIVCVRVLDPRPHEAILDMCAAPGNKTTHIAMLMKNQGTVTAVDKGKKIENINDACSLYGITCVKTYSWDSTKLFASENAATQGPPFGRDSFDRILLDSSCSGTGIKPNLGGPINQNQIRSFPKLQRKFFDNAVPLLKAGGILVYSTCSILCEENECIVSWALDKYSELELMPAEPNLGGPGLDECGLNEEQRLLVQRYGPSPNESFSSNTTHDSIGFFIAKFRKKKEET